MLNCRAPLDKMHRASRSLAQRHGALLWAGVLALVFAGVVYASYWIRFDGRLDGATRQQIHAMLLWIVLVKLGVFGWFQVYQSWNRYVTFYDLIVLGQAAVTSSLVLVLMAYFLRPDVVIPRSIFLLDCGGTIAVVGSLRSMRRLIQELGLWHLSARGQTRAFIIGANDSGEALLRAIRRNRSLSYHIVGFVGPPVAAGPTRIAGVPVVGDVTTLDRLARKSRVQEVLITADRFSGKEVRQIVDQCDAVGIAVKVLPSIEQLLHGQVDLRPRTVSIEDLLRREPVKLDMRGLHQWIDGRVLLVTGAAGSIGSEICRQLLQFDPQRLVLVDRSENGQFYLERELRRLGATLPIDVLVADVADPRRMDQILSKFKPDIIFHAAAYKHVPLMENNVGEAVKNIVLATRRLADLADQHHVSSFVMISTDKAVNPTSVMGACKRVAEIYVQAMAAHSQCQFVTVRFGNVLDSAGSVVPIFREQIRGGGPVTVTHPQMRRYFMMIPEASQLVIQAGAMGHGGEIFVLDMGEPVQIVDLAHEMIRLSGLEVGKDIEIVYSGIRPGEKLFEELHLGSERHLATSHPKIMIAESTRTPLVTARSQLRQLEAWIDRSDDRLREELQRIVPHYHRDPARRAA